MSHTTLKQPSALLLLAAVMGFLGVLAGTFGAHGLREHLPDDLLATFEIGVRYHLFHAVVMVALAATAEAQRGRHQRAIGWAAWQFAAGIVLFAGSLYALAISGHRWLGMITPLGGLLFLSGWATLAFAALRAGPACGRGAAMNGIAATSASVKRGVACLTGATLVVVTCRCATWTASEPSPLVRLEPVTQPAPFLPTSASDSAWTRFALPGDSVSVAFPTEPIVVSDSARTPIGMQPVMRYKAACDDLQFDAGYMPRSRNVLAAIAGEDSILRAACEGTAAHLKGRILSSRDLRVGGHNGCEFEVEIDDHDGHRIALARLIMTDARIYHLIVQSRGDDAAGLNSAAHRFVESMTFEPSVAVAVEN